MSVFPFTVRAIDSDGAFSDRQFSINVRNTIVERYLVINSNDAWTSSDAVNWTIRPGQGGTKCAYGNGMWMVIAAGANPGIRTSADGINWTFTPTTSLVVTRPNGDAAIWTNPPSNFGGGLSSSFSFAAGRFWFSFPTSNVGMETLSSADGLNWRRQILVPAVGTWSGANPSSIQSVSTRTVVDVGGGTLLLNSNITIAGNPLNVYGYISTDSGTTWSVLRNNALATATVQASAYLTRFNGVFYSFTSNGGNPTNTNPTYHYSTDGANWITSNTAVGNTTNTTTINQFPVTRCFYVNGRIVTLGGRAGSSNTLAHMQNRSVDGVNWQGVFNIKALNQSSAIATSPANQIEGLWEYRSGVLLGTLDTTVGTDTTSTLTVPGPGVRYSFDGGQSWAASFPRNLADTANVSSFTDVAIMG